MHVDSRRRLDAWLQTDPERKPVPLGKLWVRFRKERDLELHVRTGWVFGTEFIQLLDFVPSTGAYENEILIHAALLSELTERFSSLVRYRGRG